MTEDKLKKLISMCKCSVSVEVNGYRDNYQSIKEAVDELYCCDTDPCLTDEVKNEILSSGNLVRIIFYPDTPIGSYDISHYDLDKALDRALDVLNSEGYE